MLRVITTSLITCFLVLACHKKTIPEITARNVEPVSSSPLPVNFIADTARGKILYMTRCDRCHGIPEIGQYTSKKWDVVLPDMIPKARLSKEDGAHLTAYVNQHVKK